MSPRAAWLALSLGLLGVLAWVLWPAAGSGAEVGPLARGSATPGSAADASLEGAPELAASGAGRAALPDAPAAVRVRGAGELSGIVRARSSGLGIADLDIALFAYPPQGAEFVRRMMTLSSDPNFGQRFAPVGRARTGPDGRFRVTGVLPGKYFVQALGDLWVPDPIERVVVAPGGSEVELWVRAGAAVAGRVWRADGAPAAGVRVHVGHGESQFIPAVRSGDIAERRVETDAEGRFLAGGLPPGAGMQVSAVDADLGIAYVQGLTLVAGERAQVEVRFAPQARLTGRAVSVVGDDAGGVQALAGAELTAVPRGLRELQFVDALIEAAHGTSGADGGFALGPLAPGMVDVLAVAPGHRPARIGPVPSEPGLALDLGDVLLERAPVLRGRVVDSSGAPVAGVSVRWEPFLIQGDLDLSFAAFLTQAVPGFEFPVTDANGEFLAGPFTTDGRQRLYATKPGFQPSFVTWRPRDAGLVPVGTDPASVAPFELVLRRGGTVSGQVVDRLSGAPVTRFVIQGSDRIDQDTEAPSAFNPFGAGQVVEHPEGRFEVPAVVAGGAQLTFEAEGYLPRTRRDLVVAEGEELTGVRVELDRGAVVRGVVQDGAGQAVAGARVVAYREQGGNLFIELRQAYESGGRQFDPTQPVDFASREFLEGLPQGVLAFGVGLGVVDSVVSGPDGSFELVGVDRGEWVVLGHHRDFAEGSSRAFALDWPAGEAAPVREGVVVEMSRGAELFGTVRDRRGTPQQGVMVLAFSPAAFTTAPNSGGAYQAESQADGSYSIPNMVGGGYFLMVSRGDEQLDPFSFLSTMQLELVVVPSRGEVRRDLVDQSAATAHVHGVVRRAGAPVSGGSLMALSSGSGGLLGVDLKAAAVGHDGSYAFPGLPPGSYRLRYLAEGRPSNMSVTIPDREDVRLDLDLPGGAVTGRVVDAVTGQGVARAFVDVVRTDDDFALTGLLGAALQTGLRPSGDRTDGDGRFEVPGLEAGRYRVELNTGRSRDVGQRYQPPAAVEVVVADGAPGPEVRLELEPSLEVTGSVRDERGAPLADVRVSAWRPAAEATGSGLVDPGDVLRARTGADGRFALRGVGAGDLRLRFTHADHAPLEALDVVVAPGLAPLDVVLLPGTPVRVRVVDAAGLPALGATARLRAESGAVVGGDASLMEWFDGRGIVGPDGYADLGVFAPGSYRLEVRRGAALATEDGVQLDGGGAVTLEARLD